MADWKVLATEPRRLTAYRRAGHGIDKNQGAPAHPLRCQQEALRDLEELLHDLEREVYEAQKKQGG